MSGIARLMLAAGFKVSGSDCGESEITSGLKREGAQVRFGHAASNLGDADIVVISSAIKPDNPELKAALARGLKIVRRARMLSKIAELKKTVTVAGSHGKTTTTSMISSALLTAGAGATTVVGGIFKNIGSNVSLGKSEYFVMEADESDGSFLDYSPLVACVTNIDSDHLDHYGSFEAMRSAFGAFLQVARQRVVGGDDAEALTLARAHGADTVGVGENCSHRMTDLDLSRSSVAFNLTGAGGVDLGRLAVPVPGLHNARNAAVAAVAALAAGVAFDDAAAALARFAGVARRFEFRGVAGGVTFVDDYAHLPSEVEAALAAAKDGAWQRIVAVFQPHRYSRTAALSSDFGAAFAQADVVVVTDVYGAGEPPIPGVSGRLVADAVRRAEPGKPVVYVAGRAELRAEVASLLTAGDLCCTLGAGDLTSLPDELLAAPSW